MKKFFPYIFPVLAGLLYLICQVQKISYSADDTFIYMQYARNIAEGNGFAFNPGEPSYGVTSPLWALLVSLAYFIGIDGFLFAKVLDLIFAVASVYCLYKLSDFLFKENLFLTMLTVSLFVLNIWFIRWSFTGMETNLAVSCILLIFFFYYRDEYNIVFFLLGLLSLIRPEGFLLFLVILSALIFEKYKFLKVEYRTFARYIAIFLIVISPFMAYFKVTFGTILPNTLTGKATFAFSLPAAAAQIKGIVKTLSPSSGLEILLAVIFIFYSLRKKNIWIYTAMWLWPSALLLISVITDSDIISRYFLIIIPVFTILAVKCVELTQKRQFVFGAILFFITVLQSQFLFYKYVKPHTDGFTAGVNECMIPIGKWFSKNTPPDSRILVNDVGAIGYYSERYIIDAAALINSDLELNKKIMQTPVEERKTAANLLKFVNADYIVERDSAAEPDKGSGFEFLFYKTFPGLGISNPSPRYYKVYRAVK